MIQAQKWMRLVTTLAAMSLLVSGTGACSDDDDDDEPEIGQIRLTIGTVNITSIATQPPTGTVIIPRGNHTVSVVTMTNTGATLTLGAEFELRIQSTNPAAFTYTRSTAFTGSAVAGTAGTSTLTVQLFHLGENHADYTVTFPVTVQ